MTTVLARLFLLFTLVPLADLLLLVWVGRHTHWAVGLGLVIVPALLGAWLVRHEGVRCLRDIRKRLGRGELPTRSLLDGILILAAGVLLISPGVVTDLAGLSLLLPPVRRLVRFGLIHRFSRRVLFGGASRRREVVGHRVLDARVVDVDSRPVDGP